MFKKQILLTEGDQINTHVQLLRVSTFNYAGEEIVIDPKLLAQLKANFDEKVRGYPDGMIPVDYFHEGDRLAAGWIRALSIEADGTELWADVKWTPTGEQTIKNGELRYLSIEYSPNYLDPESNKEFGPTIFGAGLTNRPAVKGMAPVAKFSLTAEQQTLADDLQTCVSGLIPELIAKGHDQQQAIAIAYSKCGEKKMADLTAKKEICAMEMKPEEMLAKIVELEKALADLKAQYETSEADKQGLQKQVTQAQQEKAMAEKTTLFNKMMSEGKAVEAQREAFMGNDVIKFTELSQPVNSGVGSSNPDTTKKFDSAQDEVLELARKMSNEKKLSLHVSIGEVLASRKDLAEKYSKETA